jgi:gamma-tubulin complex component 3
VSAHAQTHASPASKAEILRQWRTTHGRCPFPEHLLLRDALYLLQGIDGRYVRFAVVDAPNGNGHGHADRDRHDRHGSSYGRNDRSRTEALDADEEREIVGIDIVVDEPTVSLVNVDGC